MSGHLFAVAAADVATTTDDWYTPRWIFDAAGITSWSRRRRAGWTRIMPSPSCFDMDVAAPMRRYLTAVDDGLTTPWQGVVPTQRDFTAGNLDMQHVPATLLTVEFHRPGGEVAPIRWLNLLAGKGETCAPAVARVAARDKHADGGYFVRGAAR